MGQQDCLDFLKAQRRKNNKWFRVKDVQDALRKKGLGEGTIRKAAQNLLVLTQFNDIEMRGVGVWKHYKEFRAKNER